MYSQIENSLLSNVVTKSDLQMQYLSPILRMLISELKVHFFDVILAIYSYCFGNKRNANSKWKAIEFLQFSFIIKAVFTCLDR